MSIGSKYEQFIQNFQRDLGKVDIDLALRSLYLESRLPSGQTPKQEVYVCYKPGVDLEKKGMSLENFFHVWLQPHSRTTS